MSMYMYMHGRARIPLKFYRADARTTEVTKMEPRAARRVESTTWYEHERCCLILLLRRSRGARRIGAAILATATRTYQAMAMHDTKLSPVSSTEPFPPLMDEWVKRLGLHTSRCDNMPMPPMTN